ncbi:MAG TPA: hypothetical protein VLW55_00125 [Burkholderiaceae bacterium]|nr:hypothetical protein [Burkholderiaceae bacterium]
MARLDQNTLKIELLRVRASIERAEVRAAVLELEDATQRLRGLLRIASGIAQRITETRSGTIGSLVATLLGLLRERPWLLSTLVTIATRSGRRRWLTLAGVAAIAAWLAHSVAQRATKDAPRSN